MGTVCVWDRRPVVHVSVSFLSHVCDVAVWTSHFAWRYGCQLPIEIALSIPLMGVPREVLQNQFLKKVWVHQRQNTFDSLAHFFLDEILHVVGENSVAEGPFPA